MVADGYKDTEVGVIPIEWEAVELDDVSNTTRLAGYEYSEYWEEKEEGDILALKGYNIGKGKIVNRDTFYISNKLSEQLVRSKLFVGDVVFPVVGTIGNAIAITENDKYHINQNIAKITPSPILSSDYLVQFLMSSKCRKEINRFNATTSQPNVLVGSLRQFRLPLPPLKEQEKIADILSTADDKIDAIATQIEKAETLKKGLLQKLLSEGIGHTEFKDSELGKIPESWEVDKLENLTTKIGDGLHGTPKYVEQSDYYFINGNNLNGESIEITKNTKCVSEEEYIKNKKILDDTTVLLSINGTIGSLAYYSNETVMLGKSVAYMNSNNRISKQFLFYLLRSSQILNYFMLELTGTTIKNLSLKTIRNTKIPLPPLEEQKQIANILSTADEKLEVLRAKKEKCETLKKGLLQTLLTGKARVA